MKKLFDTVCYEVATRLAVVALGLMYIVSGMIMPVRATTAMRSSMKMFEDEVL